EGKAESRPVTVGEWIGDEWLVFDGIKAGERLIVDGGLLLQPGVPLTIRQAAQANPPGADAKNPPAGAFKKKTP
ncbi:MAG TPA: hypothetical protein PK311_03640, partial [Syntrophales bacterium]|nr:hypothetical protein [Syntrophales bacterium]